MVFSIFRRDKRPRNEPAASAPARPGASRRIDAPPVSTGPAGARPGPPAGYGPNRAASLPPVAVPAQGARPVDAPAARPAVQSDPVPSSGLRPQSAAKPPLQPTLPVPDLPPLDMTPAVLQPPQAAAPPAPARALASAQPVPSNPMPEADGAPLAAGLEIGTSGVAPVIEQAAILYANGQDEAAASVLAQAVRDDRLGAATLQAWRMLLDLHQFQGRQEAFEALALEYATRFESSAPAWHADAVVRPAGEQGAPARTTVTLPEVLDADVSRPIEAIDRAIERQRDLTIDCRAVRQADAQGSALLQAAIGRIERGARLAVFVAPERLADAARGIVQTGRPDPNPGGWLLWLTMLRLAGAQQPFEDASIDYCITYEISPPSWEPMPAHVRRSDAGAAEPGPGAAGAPAGSAPLDDSALRADAFVLAGELTGTLTIEIATLRAHAERQAHVLIDCRGLRRLDFTAAGQLLNAVAGLRAAGRTVQFDAPNHLVAALLAVMGLHELATVTPRRG